jgi:hypothetical protein
MQKASKCLKLQKKLRGGALVASVERKQRGWKSLVYKNQTLALALTMTRYYLNAVNERQETSRDNEMSQRKRLAMREKEEKEGSHQSVGWNVDGSLVTWSKPRPFPSRQ